MPDLDDEFGPAAGDRDTDPTHLRALAERINTLARVLELVKQAGDHRDETLADIKASGKQRDEALAEIRSSVRRVEEEVDGLLRQQSQFTAAQITTLEEIILGRDRGKWFWGRVRLVGTWFAATVACVLGLKQFWPSIAQLLRAVLP